MQHNTGFPCHRGTYTVLNEIHILSVGFDPLLDVRLCAIGRFRLAAAIDLGMAMIDLGTAAAASEKLFSRRRIPQRGLAE
jgi:hypothetical protein